MNPWIVILLVVLAIAVAVLAMRLVLLHRAVRRLTALAVGYAHGDLDGRPDIDLPAPADDLGRALRTMAQRLGRELSETVEQRNELGGVLSSMVEGVVAIDPSDRVMSLNRAAAEMLRLDPDQAVGRSIQELVRNTSLQSFVNRTLHDQAPVQDEMTLRGDDAQGNDERHIEAQSALLRDAGGHRIGVLVVLHDVTRLRRLEAVRRDFVANVSHELKTPVSAIKAAIETLAEIPLAQPDTPDAQAAARFMAIIARQTDRLSAIIDDLLSLAHIEQDQSTGQFVHDLRPRPVQPVIAAAVETCQAKADARGISIEVRCPPDLDARISPPLLEQALVNLIDNAVKYSPERRTVRIEAQRIGREVVIAVIDQGRGIEPRHLPRVFERFYRTDRARSRELGGTGLGLSIVKHVAEAHGGRASADSQPGVGSTFRLHLLPSESTAVAVAIGR